MVTRQSQESDDHKEDDETTDQEKQLPVPCRSRRPRLKRVRLPQHVVPVEVPRSKAHRVQPVLPSMSVSGHRLAMRPVLSRLARRYAAPPGDEAEHAQGHSSKSVREYSNVALGVDRRVVPTAVLVEPGPAPRTPYGSDRAVRAGPSGPICSGDQPAESVLRRATVGGVAHQGYRVFFARR